MEDYKRKLERRRWVACLMLCIATVLVVVEVMMFIKIDKDPNAHFNEGFILGFQSGLILVMFVKSIVDIFSLTRTLKDERKIRLLYNKEHDERMQMINAKCGYPLIQSIAMFLIFMAIIAGYFNIIVFYTLVAVVMLLLIVSALFRVYYSKKM
ncbi:hypothetical protein [Amedibacillus sp. YH-ame10]